MRCCRAKVSRPAAGAARRARPPRNRAERAPTLGRVCGTVATSVRAWAYKEGQDSELLNGCGQGNLLWRLRQRELFCATWHDHCGGLTGAPMNDVRRYSCTAASGMRKDRPEGPERMDGRCPLCTKR